MKRVMLKMKWSFFFVILLKLVFPQTAQASDSPFFLPNDGNLDQEVHNEFWNEIAQSLPNNNHLNSAQFEASADLTELDQAPHDAEQSELEQLTTSNIVLLSSFGDRFEVSRDELEKIGELAPTIGDDIADFKGELPTEIPLNSISTQTLSLLTKMARGNYDLLADLDALSDSQIVHIQNDAQFLQSRALKDLLVKHKGVIPHQMGYFGLLPDDVLNLVITSYHPILVMGIFKFVCQKTLKIVTEHFKKLLIGVEPSRLIDELFLRTDLILNNCELTDPEKVLALDAIHNERMALGLVSFLPKSKNVFQALSNIYIELEIWNRFEIRGIQQIDEIIHLAGHIQHLVAEQTGAEVRDNIRKSISVRFPDSVPHKVVAFLGAPLKRPVGDQVEDQVKARLVKFRDKAIKKDNFELYKLTVRYILLIHQITKLAQRSPQEFSKIRDKIAMALDGCYTEEQAQAILNGITIPENGHNPILNIQLELLRRHLGKYNEFR